MEKFFSKLIALAVLLIMAPSAAVFASNDDGDTEEEQTLQELLDSFKFGVDDYAYGSAPGYVGDEVVYEEFYNIYSDAIQMASSTTATDEDKAAMCVKLKEAKAKVEAAINPVTDGTYYIVTTYSAFADKDTMAWFAPNEGNYPGWKKKEPKVLFLWNVKKLASGNYSIQSLATGQYVNHNDVIDGQETNMYMTNTLETEQVFDNISPNGQFNIHCVGANWTYNIQHHNSGNAVTGPIGNWKDKNVSGEGSWKLVPVSEADLALVESTRNRDLLQANINSFVPGDYTFGKDPGQYSKEAFDALNAELTASKNMLADSVTTPTEEACKVALDKFVAAKAALDASLVEVTDGYYTISTNTYAAVTEQGKNASAWTAKNSYLYAFGWETLNPAYIWKITKLASGNYSIQSRETGEYINTTDLYQAGASIGLSKSQNTEMVITRNKGEKFYIVDAATKSHNMSYATATDLCWVQNGNGSDLYLHKYSDEEVASLDVLYPQKLRTDTLRSLIVETSARANVDSIYTINMDAPIITSASQLYITNQSTEGADLNRLLDNDPETHCISAYNNSTVEGTDLNDYHALRIDAGEGKVLPHNIALHWRARGSAWKAMYRPIDVQFYASNDAVNWEYIGERKNPQAGFPTAAEDPEYTAADPVVMPAGYRYLNMKVIKTNTMDLGKYGYPFFTFSEFQAYPMTAEVNPNMTDPEINQAIQDLRAAIATARVKAESGNVSSQDIADLRGAYTNLLLVWKDTTDICLVLSKAKAFAPKVAEGSEPFYFPGNKISAFEEALVEVDDAYPFEDLKQREIARLDTLLTRAYNELVNSMVGPDPDTWYFVSCADETAVDGAGNPVKGKYSYMGGLSASDGLGCVGLENNIKDLRRVWKFEATGTPNVYNMICVANGYPINRGPVRLDAIGDGQFAIYTNADLNAAYFINGAILPGVPSMGGKAPEANGWGAWAMEEISPEMTSRITLRADKVFARVNPFDTEDMPSAYTEGHNVQTYSVCGYEVGDDGKTITAINLTEYVPDAELGGIPAGTPYVMIVDDLDAYDPETPVVIDLHPAHGGNVTHEAKMVNGLGGQFASWPYPTEMLYFQANVAKVHGGAAGTWILDPQDAYLDPSQIVNDPEASIDAVVPVDSSNGTVEIPNGIASLINSQKAIVNVYTTDGVLVKKNVKAVEATKGLKKGVYVVGKNKVLVK